MVTYFDDTVTSPGSHCKQIIAFVPQIEADTAANGCLQSLTMAKYEL